MPTNTLQSGTTDIESTSPYAFVPGMRSHQALSDLLDHANTAITQNEVMYAGVALGPELNSYYHLAEQNGTFEEAKAVIKMHPVYEACMTDPYTRRAFDKPRGYAGDALMLDYIYRPDWSALSDKSRTVHSVTTLGPMGLSIKYRREFLRAHIDQTVATTPNARILSVASGHCRELDDCLLRRHPQNAQFIALDQDKESCEYVRKEYQAPWLEVREENVKQLLRPGFDIGQFDCIYSAGLYDYLPDAIATALTSSLEARLKPGGRLLLANFLPDCHGRGYMEFVMDWRLIWRTNEQMRTILPASMQSTAAVAADPHQNVVYALWTKPVN
jgi:extracellular factor (EF) 3-hydroxypalmitic acid methyl ester biosynthesis protein